MPYKDPIEAKKYQAEYRKRPHVRKKHVQDVKKRQKRIQVWYLELKSTYVCIECGEDHPACLEFHHREPRDKEIAVSRAALQNGWSKERILSEIAKCDCLCSNCHRKLHYKLRGHNLY